MWKLIQKMCIYLSIYRWRLSTPKSPKKKNIQHRRRRQLWTFSKKYDIFHSDTISLVVVSTTTSTWPRRTSTLSNFPFIDAGDLIIRRNESERFCFVFVSLSCLDHGQAYREFIRKKRTQKVLRSDHISQRISTETRFTTAERESARWFNSWTNDVSFSAISRIFSSLQLITPTIPYLYLSASASSKWRLITKYMIQQANMRDFVKLYRISRNNAADVHKQQVDIFCQSRVN